MGRRPYAAVVLAGATSERLGGADKAVIEIAGTTLLDRVLDAVTDATNVSVVGPERATSRPVTWCQENPIGGGPVAAFGAGLALHPDADIVLLVATDLPFIAGAVPLLLDALGSTTDVAVLRDRSGRANYLASAWRRHTVLARMTEIGDLSGLAMRRLLNGLRVTEVADTGDWGFDCDTPEALEIARRRESGSGW